MIKIIIFTLLVLIAGCSNAKKPIQGELKALDNFFKLLGQNSEKSKDVKNEEQESPRNT